MFQFLRRWWSAFRPRDDSQRGDHPLGPAGEVLAERALQSAGLRVIGRNVRLQRGELDLIAADGDTIVFVEVKTREGIRKGRPEDAVTDAKIRQVSRLAAMWLKKHRLLQSRCRFDVIAVEFPARQAGQPRGEPQIRWYRHAFQALP